VADFGIALALQEAGGGRLTETGLSMGTPYYMSPEQATADRDPDARSDVYSLGSLFLVRRMDREQSGAHPVVWMGEDGSVERIPIPLVAHADPSVSPDGRLLAYVSTGRVRVFDMDLGNDVDLTDGLEIDPQGTHNPVWSPDGSRIASRAGKGEATSLFVTAADGSGTPRRVGAPGDANGPSGSTIGPCSWKRVSVSVVSLEVGDQLWDLDEARHRFLVFRNGRIGHGFPDSELEVVTNWRRTVVDSLSGSGR